VPSADTMRPVSYDLDHVDVDRHVAFPLVRRQPVRPAPTLALTNVASVSHGTVTFYRATPFCPRVLLPGDWT
jgi:hypothetical protein